MDTLANRYALEEIIGEGAVATVYRARDTLKGGTVAVKVLKDIHDEMDTARLWVEMRSLQRLRHPRIIRTLDVGKSGLGQHYIAMELLEGRTLRSRMVDEGRMAVADVLVILHQVIEALDACHFSGIIHRDLKPENVFLLAPDDTQVKLIDFGMAKILHDLSPSLTQDAMIFGTPEYMAPERITGGDPTPATDIYAAGVLTFEMLAGLRPFAGSTPEQIMRRQLHDAIPRFSELTPPVSVPREVRAVIRRCLRKAPLQRPRASVLAAELQSMIARGPLEDHSPEGSRE
ncbi:MAG: serine/threonine-protein kinase [bacterium]